MTDETQEPDPLARLKQMRGPTEFERVEAEMKEKGFDFVSRESLTEIYFDGSDPQGRYFKTRPAKTRNQVADEFKDRIIENNPDVVREKIEIELIDCPPLGQGQEAVYIFAKYNQE